MPLPPTNKPLTVKEFESAVFGVCGGCSCACGYIAYLKEKKLVDLYGHPKDPNSIGSFCSKGITYIQQIPQNPLRVRKPFLRKENSLKELKKEDVISALSELSGARVGFFFDRFFGLEEYLIARSLTDRVYTDALFLPFLQTSTRPQSWARKKALLIFEAEMTFSEVMLTRWVVDAFEADAYILSVGTRFTTVSQKSTEFILKDPEGVVEVLESLANGEGPKRALSFLEHFPRDTSLIVGDTLLRSPFKNRTLKALKELRKKYGCDYTIVGNVTPFFAKGIKELRQEIHELDALVAFGNPFLYFSDEELREINLKVINFAYFPTLSANHSTLVIPRELFFERDFIVRGVGFLSYSPKVLEPPFEVSHRLLSRAFGVEPDLEGFLSSLGISLKDLITAEGGLFMKGKDITEFEFEKEERAGGELWVVCDNTLVDELGHWNIWTHAIEREQRARANSRTIKTLGKKVRLGRAEFVLVEDNNLADGVVFVPNAYEEFQPFDAGVRVGNILKNPHLRVESL
ncbi:MAG: dehydrogenase [Aquificae bacterium]|nr:dehydrogenase [Aquificota bacterium]